MSELTRSLEARTPEDIELFFHERAAEAVVALVADTPDAELAALLARDEVLALRVGGMFTVPGSDAVAVDPTALDPVDVSAAIAGVTDAHLREVMAGGFRDVVLSEVFRRMPTTSTESGPATTTWASASRSPGAPTVAPTATSSSSGTASARSPGPGGRRVGAGRDDHAPGRGLPQARHRAPEPAEGRDAGSAAGQGGDRDRAAVQQPDGHPEAAAPLIRPGPDPDGATGTAAAARARSR